MLPLLLDLENLLGLPEGLVAREALARHYGDRAVEVAQACGLVRFYCPPLMTTEGQLAEGSVGLTPRGRLVAAHPMGKVCPIELATQPHKVISAVLCGAMA